MNLYLVVADNHWYDYLFRTDPEGVNFCEPVHDLSKDGFIPRTDCAEIQRFRRDSNVDPAVRYSGVG